MVRVCVGVIDDYDSRPMFETMSFDEFEAKTGRLVEDEKYMSEPKIFFQTKLGALWHGDCLDVMSGMEDKSVDLVLCDLPYGTTACLWDIVIPFAHLWKQYERIIKDSGAIILTASQPFTTDLINSNRKLFRYELIWEKSVFSNPLMANKQILKIHENILIFYKKQPVYNPQMRQGKPYQDRIRPGSLQIQGCNQRLKKAIDNQGLRYPTSVLYFQNPNNENFHPTQKPIDLFRYLIMTYSNYNNVVMDNCLGSGTTAIACEQTGRRWIGIELDEKYCEIAKQRILRETRQLVLTEGAL